jgi:hypothetical protein
MWQSAQTFEKPQFSKIHAALKIGIPEQNRRMPVFSPSNDDAVCCASSLFACFQLRHQAFPPLSAPTNNWHSVC